MQNVNAINHKKFFNFDVRNKINKTYSMNAREEKNPFSLDIYKKCDIL